ncbi:MAG: hypothetical protein RIS36_1595 [Pseudomonadota bacterium]|jgi:hypothetical protein
MNDDSLPRDSMTEEASLELLQEFSNQKASAEELLAFSNALFERGFESDAMEVEKSAFEHDFRKASEGSLEALLAVKERFNRLIDGLIQQMVSGE